MSFDVEIPNSLHFTIAMLVKIFTKRQKTTETGSKIVKNDNES